MKNSSYTISSLLLLVWQDEDEAVCKGVLESHVYIYNIWRVGFGVYGFYNLQNL